MGRNALPLSETDNSGTVIGKPVKGWTVTDTSRVAVLAAIQYAETPEEFDREDSKSIHLVLTAPQCLDLADALTRAARDVLRSHSPRTPLP